MKKPRHDRYTTRLNVKELIAWLCGRPDYLIEKLEINDPASFQSWLKELKKQSQRLSREDLRDRVHTELPMFIGNESHWQHVKSAFRKSLSVADKQQITVDRDVFIELTSLKKSIDAETYNSALLMLLESADAVRNYDVTMRTWRALLSATCQSKFGRIMASELSSAPLPKSIQARLPWYFQSTMAMAIKRILEALSAAMSDTSKRKTFSISADVTVNSVSDVLKHVKLKRYDDTYSVECGYETIAYLSLKVDQITGFISIGAELSFSLKS